MDLKSIGQFSLRVREVLGSARGAPRCQYIPEKTEAGGGSVLSLPFPASSHVLDQWRRMNRGPAVSIEVAKTFSASEV